MRSHSRPCGRALLVYTVALAGLLVHHTPTAGSWSAGAEAIPAGPHVPPTRYVSDTGYSEYWAGNSPLIISVPHDGTLRPSTIPNRNSPGVDCDDNGEDFLAANDTDTKNLGLRIRDEIIRRTGRYPHVIINNLDRVKLDVNRTIEGGACHHPLAEAAWRDYHDFIEVAKQTVVAQFGTGWYSDLHGHGHAIRRIELGFHLTDADLRQSDATLDSSVSGPPYWNKSSVRTFRRDQPPRTLSRLLRGNTGLGTLFGAANYRSVPSAQDRAPVSGQPYYPSGESLRMHACDATSPLTSEPDICGVQLELYKFAPGLGVHGIRDTADNREDFAEALVGIYEVFLAQNFGISLVSARGETIVDNDNANNEPARARASVTSSWGPRTAYATVLNNYHQSSAPGPSGDGATFWWYVPSPGTYRVYAWWTSNASRSTGVRYRVYTRDTTLATYRVFDGSRNQRINGGRWNLLGTWQFPTVGFAKVLISRSLSTSGTLAADAIRAVRVDGQAAPAQPLRPRGWYARDIGAVGVTGSASESNGTWTVRGAGADVWGAADAFQYQWRWLSGDGSITARVASLAGSQDWTKVGVMMRGSTAPNSAHAFLLVAKAARGLAFHYRLSTGGTTSSVAAGSGTAPRWIRLTRAGSSIAAATSSDGVSWTSVGTQTYSSSAMAPKVLVGLAVSGHTTASLATGVFDNVSVVP